MAESLKDLLSQANIVGDCTPKKVLADWRRGVKFIVEGSEKHAVSEQSFVAKCKYANAVAPDAASVFPATGHRSRAA